MVPGILLFEIESEIRIPGTRKVIMPNCFTLTRKTDLKAGPVALMTVDAEMCRHFGADVDPVHFFHSWYDTIGLLLALGKDWNEIREMFHGPTQMVAIVDWLEANFTTDAWYEPK